MMKRYRYEDTISSAVRRCRNVHAEMYSLLSRDTFVASFLQLHFIFCHSSIMIQSA